jgi:hypothetical protein
LKKSSIAITALETARASARRLSIGSRQLAVGNSPGRAAADVDERESLEETAIVELLRYAQWRVDSHGCRLKSSGCATGFPELFTIRVSRGEALQPEMLRAAWSEWKIFPREMRAVKRGGI